MITYTECLKGVYEKAGIDITCKDVPEKKYKFYAYRSGSHEIFDTRTAALEYSSLVERVWINEEEYRTYVKTISAAKAEALALWEQYLRAEYGYLSDEVFSLCYDFAKEQLEDREFCDYYDELSTRMEYTVDFANKLKSMVKNGL